MTTSATAAGNRVLDPPPAKKAKTVNSEPTVALPYKSPPPVEVVAVNPENRYNIHYLIIAHTTELIPDKSYNL